MLKIRQCACLKSITSSYQKANEANPPAFAPEKSFMMGCRVALCLLFSS